MSYAEQGGCRYGEAAHRERVSRHFFHRFGVLSCNVIVPLLSPNISQNCFFQLLHAIPPGNTLHLQCGFYYQLVFLLNLRLLFRMTIFFLISFSRHRAPSSEIRWNTFFEYILHLIVITLKNSCVCALFVILIAEVGSVFEHPKSLSGNQDATCNCF